MVVVADLEAAKGVLEGCKEMERVYGFDPSQYYIILLERCIGNRCLWCSIVYKLRLAKRDQHRCTSQRAACPILVLTHNLAPSKIVCFCFNL